MGPKIFGRAGNCDGKRWAAKAIAAGVATVKKERVKGEGVKGEGVKGEGVKGERVRAENRPANLLPLFTFSPFPPFALISIHER